MPMPLIALFSDDRQLAAELKQVAGGEFAVHHCEAVLSHLPEEIRDIAPNAVIADFTTVSSGGHAEDRVLEAIQRDDGERPLFMLTGADCPEPLARRAACTPLIHLAEPPFAEQIVQQLCCLFNGQKQTESAKTGESRECPNRQAEDEESPPPRNGEDRTGGCGFSEVVVRGKTHALETRTLSMKLLLQELELAAGHDVTILLVGETGVGKTYLARLIHEISSRRDQPFLPVACGALPEELMESELFGHVKGAFTSAHADKDGKFLVAGAGTILLDEIDVLGLEQQVKLLRVIETGEFEPVGSNTTHHSQARLIVASNRQLEPLVEKGAFRADLYYRLNMLKFDIPPLRDRRTDIPLLAEMFIRRHAAEHGITIKRIDPRVVSSLQNYAWPGNVRELENVLRRAVIYCRDGILRAEHLPSALRDIVREASSSERRHNLADSAPPANARQQASQATYQASLSGSATLPGQIEDTERQIIQQALQAHNFSRTKTAKALGISRVTLYNKICKYDIQCG